MARLKRDIGLVGLTFISVGGIIGSGWLFGPLLAVQHAGPAAIFSWIIGAAAMFILAITFAEISAMLPIPGGIARVPQFSHGNIVSMAMGWTAWIGYNTTAPIEVEAMLKYLAPYAPWLHTAGTGDLTGAGITVALFFMLLFVAVNALGVKFFTQVNATLTWAKIAIPIVLAALLIANRFDTHNFTQPDGFAPYGLQGIMAAVSTGGVIFSFIGFRHVVDMAGEVRNPKFAIPAALILSIVLCALIYVGLQIAFIGALDSKMLSNGWASLSFGGQGPLDGVIISVGFVWFLSVLNIGSVIGPFGNGLVSTGSKCTNRYGFGKKRIFAVTPDDSVDVRSAPLGIGTEFPDRHSIPTDGSFYHRHRPERRRHRAVLCGRPYRRRVPTPFDARSPQIHPHTRRETGSRFCLRYRDPCGLLERMGHGLASGYRPRHRDGPAAGAVP